MTTFFVTLALVALAVTGMAIGVLLGRPALSGSCGGVVGCAFCPQRRCPRSHAARTDTSVAENDGP
jgi:hypothetical protein